MRRLIALSALTSLTAVVACTEDVIVRREVAPTETPAETPTEQTRPEEQKPEPPKRVYVEPLAIDLGDVVTGRDVEFNVPAGAIGFHVVVDGERDQFDPSAPLGIESIVDPKGKAVHQDFAPAGGSHPTSFAFFDAIAAASVPQSEAATAPIEAGMWKVRFGLFGTPATSSPPKLRAKVLVQSSADGEFHGGALDLHVHVPAGLRIESGGRLRQIDPAKAADDPTLSAALDRFFGMTSELLGIERGDVKFHVAPAAMADLDGAQAIVEGFAISAGARDGEQALHVLLTNSISEGGQPVAAGISPGIPGVANRFGTGASGIIVATYGGAQEISLTMLHEAGHFFGLNHTTEFSGDAADPLADTPRCETIADNDLMSCPDRRNVMFPAGPVGVPALLSPTQKRVYQGSPIYKALRSKPAQTTMRRESTVSPLQERRFHTQSRALSPVERELALGFCGLNRLDADGMVRRHGRDAAIAQLRAAAKDAGLAPVIRGRAHVALERLGVTVE